MFSSKSSLNTSGYLYEHQFNPYDSIDTSLARNDDSCGNSQLEIIGPWRFNNQFEIIAYLKSNITYTLIVTTSYAYGNGQGPFSVFVEGQGKIEIKQMSMYTNSNFNLIL